STPFPYTTLFRSTAQRNLNPEVSIIGETSGGLYESRKNIVVGRNDYIRHVNCHPGEYSQCPGQRRVEHGRIDALPDFRYPVGLALRNFEQRQAMVGRVVAELPDKIDHSEA